MGRTKGVKNKHGHKAGGARKGSGRKPKSIEDGPNKQTIGSSRPHATRVSRNYSTKPNIDDNRIANILPAPASTTQHDTYAQPYQTITSNTFPERYSHTTCTPASPAWAACPPLPLPLTSKEPYHVSPANSRTGGENIKLQSSSELANLGIRSIERPAVSYPPVNMAQSQPIPDYISTYTPINSPMCSPILEGSYSQLEPNYWNVAPYPSDANSLPASYTESSSAGPHCSSALSYSSISSYTWPSSPLPLSSTSQESPASSYSSLESPMASSPVSLTTLRPRRRPRRCAVCLTYGDDLNALACPGRGDRNRCPYSKTYDTHATPHSDAADNRYFPSGQIPIPREDVNIYGKYSDDPHVNLYSPFADTTIDNFPRRPRHCKICTTTGKPGTTCPGRGNRTLCPDFTF